MKRRDFLKILGACVVAPGTAITAIKARPKPIKFGIPYWVDDPVTCYGKHGQRCVCNSCFDDMITDCLPDIYKASIKKDPKYNVGDKIKTSDGRVYCYIKFKDTKLVYANKLI